MYCFSGDGERAGGLKQLQLLEESRARMGATGQLALWCSFFSVGFSFFFTYLLYLLGVFFCCWSFGSGWICIQTAGESLFGSFSVSSLCLFLSSTARM